MKSLRECVFPVDRKEIKEERQGPGVLLTQEERKNREWRGGKEGNQESMGSWEPRDKGSQAMLATIITTFWTPKRKSLCQAITWLPHNSLWLILTSGPWFPHHHPYLIWFPGCFLNSPFINQKGSLRTEDLIVPFPRSTGERTSSLSSPCTLHTFPLCLQTFYSLCCSWHSLP